MDREKVWQSLNSDLSRLIIGFVLTTLVGGLLTQWYQDQNWRRQSQFEYEKRQLDEAQKFIERLSTSVSLHLWNLRELELLLSGATPANPEELEKVWTAFKEGRNKWYMDLPLHQSKANLLLAPGMKELLRTGNETQDPNLQNPKSLAGFFAIAERSTLRVTNCVRSKTCQPTAGDIAQMKTSIDRLETAATRYLEYASNLIYRKSIDLQPLTFE